MQRTSYVGDKDHIYKYISAPFQPFKSDMGHVLTVSDRFPSMFCYLNQ